MKDRLLVFTDGGCRFEKEPGQIRMWLGHPNVVLNPDLAAVYGLDRKYWKLEGGKVLPMSPQERKKRNESLTDVQLASTMKKLTPAEHVKLLTGKQLPQEASHETILAGATSEHELVRQLAKARKHRLWRKELGKAILWMSAGGALEALRHFLQG